MNNAVIYARYSSDHQNPISIDKQIDICKEFAKVNDYNVIDIYSDAGITGTDDKRPGFQAMIQDSKIEKFKYVIVYDYSRFSRDIEQQLYYERLLKSKGISIKSVRENFGEDASSFMFKMMSYSFNAYYSKQIAEKIKDGYKAKDNKIRISKRATFYGGKTAYGYSTIDGETKNEKFLVINESEANVVKMVFDWYLSGMGYKKIINKLNELGITRRNGKSFTVDGIKFMLSYEPYTGVFIRHINTSQYFYSKDKNLIRQRFEEEVRIEDSMPVIIDKDTFFAVQKKLSSNKDEGKRKRAKNLYLLSGLVYCGKCGSVMIGNNNGSRAYYVCPTRAKSKQCDQNAIRKDLLEYIVINFLKKTITENVINSLIEYLYKNKDKFSSKIENEIKTLDKSTKSAQQKIDRITAILLESGSKVDSLVKKLSELEKLKKENQSKLDNLKLQQQTSNNQISKETIKKYIQSVVDIDNKTNEQKRVIIVNLVKKITIISHNDDNGDKKPLFDVIIEGDLGKLCANNLSTHLYHKPKHLATSRETWEYFYSSRRI